MVLWKKLVIVGDKGCGKSSLLPVVRENCFPIGLLPIAYWPWLIDVEVDGVFVELSITDTKDYDECADYRFLHEYPGTHVVLICFSVDSPVSFRNVSDKWAPEVDHYCPNVPIVLVGTKKDLRNDPLSFFGLKEKPVKSEEGRAMAKKIGSIAYLECSAKNKDGVHDVFEKVTRAALSMMRRNRKCTIL